MGTVPPDSPHRKRPPAGGLKATRLGGQDYTEAVRVLNATLRELDRGIGCAWGLHRGTWGYMETVRARDRLLSVRDSMLSTQTKEEIAE